MKKHLWVLGCARERLRSCNPRALAQSADSAVVERPPRGSSTGKTVFR